VASANVELVRSIFAAWEQGDLGSVAWADPEIEFVFADGPEPGSYSGVASMQVVFRSWLNAFAGFRLWADDVIELDDERVLALTNAGGHGRTSGADLELARSNAAHLFQLRAGKVVRLAVYFERNHAFANLGVVRDADAPGS
jgi:ketosteroid isomerase-like protein